MIFFDNNFGIENYFTKYLRKSCWLCSYCHFSIRCVSIYAFAWCDFIKIVRLLLAAVSMNGLIHLANGIRLDPTVRVYRGSALKASTI